MTEAERRRLANWFKNQKPEDQEEIFFGLPHDKQMSLLMSGVVLMSNVFIESKSEGAIHPNTTYLPLTDSVSASRLPNEKPEDKQERQEDALERFYDENGHAAGFSL